MTTPRVVIAPPAIYVAGGGGVADLLTADIATWATLRAAGATTVLSTGNFLNRSSDATLTQYFANLVAAGCNLQLEDNVISPGWAGATTAFNWNRPRWDRFLGLGAPLTSIAMQEPWIKAQQQLTPPLLDSAVIAWLTEFIGLVAASYPMLSVGDVEAWPFMPASRHIAFVQALIDSLAQAGQPPLAFYRIDPDWNALRQYNPHAGSTDTWADLRSIQATCQINGLPFSLIYWCPRPQGGMTDQGWRAGLQTEFNGYATLPDEFCVESWIGSPSTTVPDSAPLSFTGAALGLLALVGLPPPVPPSMPPPPEVSTPSLFAQSAYRTVYVFPGGFTAPWDLPTLSRWPDRGSTDVLDYWVDAAGWLTDAEVNPGPVPDTLVAVGTTVDPAGGLPALEVEDARVVDGVRVLLLLRGGIPGTMYSVRVRLFAASGRIVTALVLVFVDADAGATGLGELVASNEDVVDSDDNVVVNEGTT